MPPVARRSLTSLGRALGDDAGDAHDVLGAHVDRVVDHALGHARVVAEVDEGELLAVLAAAGDPAGERDAAGRCARGAARRTGGYAWTGGGHDSAFCR